MKLTKKIVFVIFLLCIVFSLVFFLLFRLILHDSLEEQKSRFVQRVIAGVVSVIEKETERILTFSADWAVWDTMYEYASHPTPEIEKNLSIPLSIRDGDFSLLVVVSQNKKIVNAVGYSHLSNKPVTFGLLKQKKGDTWKFLMQTFDKEESVRGIIQSELGPMIAVSSPIFHSDLSGPQNGRLLMSRLIDKSFEERIGKVISWKTRLLTGAGQKKWESPDQGKFLVEEKPQTMVIYYPVTDVWDRHAFTLRIDAQKDTFIILERATHYFFFVLVIGILLLSVILYFIMDRLVVQPVKHISNTTNRILSLDDLSQRIHFSPLNRDEITQLGENINEMLKRLQSENITKEEVEHMAMMNEKLIFLGRVAASVGHEINNPLFAIGNSIEVIKQHLPLNPGDNRLNEVVQVVEREIKRVKTIVQNIHKFAIPRIEETKLSDITSIIDAAVKVINWSKQLKHTTIDYLKKNHSFPLYCHPEPLQQVFMNIILNSIEAMEGKGRLVIDVFEESDSYRIDFIDNGPGFSESIKTEIFEPFKSTKSGKGSGLGLNISYNIIRNHGGTITLNENYHQGAHLIIKIPKGDKKNDGKANTAGN
ncbi:CHASE4 domain-containing protein [Acidobacteriota bacterium]